MSKQDFGRNLLEQVSGNVMDAHDSFIAKRLQEMLADETVGHESSEKGDQNQKSDILSEIARTQGNFSKIPGIKERIEAYHDPTLDSFYISKSGHKRDHANTLNQLKNMLMDVSVADEDKLAFYLSEGLDNPPGQKMAEALDRKKKAASLLNFSESMRLLQLGGSNSSNDGEARFDTFLTRQVTGNVASQVGWFTFGRKQLPKTHEGERTVLNAENRSPPHKKMGETALNTVQESDFVQGYECRKVLESSSRIPVLEGECEEWVDGGWERFRQGLDWLDATLKGTPEEQEEFKAKEMNRSQVTKDKSVSPFLRDPLLHGLHLDGQGDLRSNANSKAFNCRVDSASDYHSGVFESNRGNTDVDGKVDDTNLPTTTIAPSNLKDLNLPLDTTMLNELDYLKLDMLLDNVNNAPSSKNFDKTDRLITLEEVRLPQLGTELDKMVADASQAYEEYDPRASGDDTACLSQTTLMNQLEQRASQVQSGAQSRVNYLLEERQDSSSLAEDNASGLISVDQILRSSNLADARPSEKGLGTLLERPGQKHGHNTDETDSSTTKDRMPVHDETNEGEKIAKKVSMDSGMDPASSMDSFMTNLGMHLDPFSAQKQPDSASRQSSGPKSSKEKGNEEEQPQIDKDAGLTDADREAIAAKAMRRTKSNDEAKKMLRTLRAGRPEPDEPPKDGKKKEQTGESSKELEEKETPLLAARPQPDESASSDERASIHTRNKAHEIIQEETDEKDIQMMGVAAVVRGMRAFSSRIATAEEEEELRKKMKQATKQAKTHKKRRTATTRGRLTSKNAIGVQPSEERMRAEREKALERMDAGNSLFQDMGDANVVWNRFAQRRSHANHGSVATSDKSHEIKNHKANEKQFLDLYRIDEERREARQTVVMKNRSTMRE